MTCLVILAHLMIRYRLFEQRSRFERMSTRDEVILKHHQGYSVIDDLYHCPVPLEPIYEQNCAFRNLETLFPGYAVDGRRIFQEAIIPVYPQHTKNCHRPPLERETGGPGAAEQLSECRGAT